MNEMEKITRLLGEAQEALEYLADGEAGMLQNGTTAQNVADIIDAVRDMAGFLEDEFCRRLTRTDDLETQDIVLGWFETAAQVDARRGEEVA